MNRFGFNVYIVDDANSDAFGACRGVARLQTEKPQPIILVGDHGCGKTHLLHAIVDEVRASSAHTGIAYVSPRNLPDKIRNLVEDPTPVDRAEKAILLVDDLDRFDDDLDLLGEVVRIFLENDHHVVFASRIRPHLLDTVPPELQAALEKARVVEIAPGDTQHQINLIERRVRQESEETIARQDREIKDLKAENADRAKTSQEEDSQPLEDEHTEAGEAREEAARMLERAERLMRQMEESRGEFLLAQKDKQRQLSEIEKLEDVYARATTEQNESTAEAAQELSDLQAELESTRDERDSLQREREQLEESIVRTHSERDTIKSLLERARNELDETRRDIATVKQEAAQQVETEKLRTDALRQSLDEAREEYQKQLATQRVAAEELMALHSQLEQGPNLLERIMALLGVPPAGGAAVEEKNTEPEAAPQEDVPEAGPETEKQDTQDSILRADFGEAARFSPPGPSTLHHVEELRSRLRETPGGEGREDSAEDELQPPQDRHKSA